MKIGLGGEKGEASLGVRMKVSGVRRVNKDEEERQVERDRAEPGGLRRWDVDKNRKMNRTALKLRRSIQEWRVTTAHSILRLMDASVLSWHTNESIFHGQLPQGS